MERPDLTNATPEILAYIEYLEEEVTKVKEEIKHDIQTLNLKLEEVQESYKNIREEHANKPNRDIRNNIIIRNLRYDERERDNAEITKNLVQAMFKDGLALSNIDIRNTVRKNSNQRSPCVVIVELKDTNQKKEIFKKKKDLKKSRDYSKV